MLSFEEAGKLVLTEVPIVGTERVALHEAVGRVLRAKSVPARRSRRSRQAPMDGYAVATSSFRGGPPLPLPVTGESRMGGVPSPLAAGTSARIFTGAGLPDGADAVVMQEDVTREGDRARFATVPKVGAHIRREGEDLKRGDLALERGPGSVHFNSRWRPRSISRTRGIGAPTRDDRVHRGRAARAGRTHRPGSIAESNAAGLRGHGRASRRLRSGSALGARRRRGHAGARSKMPSRATDLLVTVGGVSVGDHDVVRPALERAGVEARFLEGRHQARQALRARPFRHDPRARPPR